MNLRQLEHFLAVARLRSFTAAAAELGVAQPTLTKSIHGLEHDLEAKLFERLPRGVALTEAGQALRRHAERIGVQMQDAARELRSLAGAAGGAVAIGAGPSWLRRLLPEAVARAVAANPKIRVSVVGGFDDVLVKALRAGELDFVVAELPPETSADDLRLETLTSDRLSVLCRAGHPLTARADHSLGALLEFPWVMPPSTTRAQQRLNALFVAADFPPPRLVAETESLAFLLQLVLASDALTFTVTSTTELAESAGTVMLEIPELQAERSAGIITRRDAWLPPAAEPIVGELRRLCRARGRN